MGRALSGSERSPLPGAASRDDVERADQHQGTPLVRFQQLAEARYWVTISLLQIRRFVTNFGAAAGGAKDSWEAQLWPADAHFLLNALGQAEKCIALSGVDGLAGQGPLIRALRNVHEHWEQHKATFERPTEPKVKSGKNLAAMGVLVPWSFRHDATGTWLSDLRLDDLWDELHRLRDALGAELQAIGPSTGTPEPALGLELGRDFPSWPSRVLAISATTQSIRLDSF